MTERGIEAVRQHLAKLPPSSSLTVAQRRAQYERAERVFPTPSDVAVEIVKAPERNAEYLRPPGVLDEALILHLAQIAAAALERALLYRGPTGL